MALTALQQTEIIRYCVGIFGAAPGGYMGDLANYVMAGNSTQTMAQVLVTSPAFKGLNFAYSDASTDQQFVDAYCANLLGSTVSADNLAAAKTWMLGLMSNGMSRAQAVVAAIDALTNVATDDATWGAARTQLDNRVSVAETYTITNSGSSTTLSTLQATIATVTEDPTTVTAANTANTTTTGQTYTLTTGADNKVGTTGNDTFDGSLSSTSMTFGPADTIDGGAGTDTLTIISNAAGTYSAGSLKNVENINLTASGGAATLSLTGVTGVSSIVNSGSTEDVTISGLGTLSTVVTVSNTGANDSTTITFAASAVSGSSDTASIVLNGIGHTTSNDTDDINIQDVETINIATSGGASTVDAFDTDAAKFVITGDQNLTIGESLEASNASLLTVDASALTGALTFTANQTTAMTITGGSGNDSFTMTGGSAVNDTINAGAGNDTVTFAANLANTDSVDGGEGTDVLSMTTALAQAYAAPTTATIANFETLKVYDANTGNFTVATIQAGITTVDLAAGTAAATVTMEAGTQTVKIGAANTGDLTVADTGTATTDSVTITNTAAAADVLAGNAVTSTGFETLTINTTGTGAATGQTVSTITVTADTGGTAQLTLTGSNSLTTTGSITAAVIDASGLTGSTGLVMGAAGTSVTSIIGGSGNDTLVGDASSDISAGAGNDAITGGANNDTLAGGDGNDSITSAAGNDTISGGAGNDTLTLAGDLTEADTIDGGDGTDTLSVSNASLTAVNALAISAIGTLNTNLSNIERLVISDDLDQTSFDMARLDSINYITISDWAGAESLIGLAADTTIKLDDAGNGTNNTDDLTVALASATGSSDSLTIALVNDNAQDFGDITIASIENLTLTTAEVTATATAEDFEFDLTATGLTTLTITGTEDLDIDAVAINATTINASGNTGYIKVLGGAANQTITGTASTDSIQGGAGADTIDGGAGADSLLSGGTGADSITAGEGADLVNGGAGNDTIILTESTAAVDSVIFDFSEGGANIDTITGFATTSSGDEIQLDISALQAVTAAGGLFTSTTAIMENDTDDTSDGVGAAQASATNMAVQVMTAAATATDEAGIFVLSGATFSTADEVEDALEAGGGFALTASTTGGAPSFCNANNVFFVVYTNGTDAKVSAVHVVSETANNAVFESGNLNVIDLVTLTGVTSISSTTFTNSNFEFIA